MTVDTLPAPPGAEDVRHAAERLSGVANRTPVLTSRTLDDTVDASVFIKCENFQRTGAFKFRGAYHALSRLSPEAREAGVLSYSSGNHGQAVALAGRLLGIPTRVVMPTDAPAAKVAATRGYGADVVLYERAETTREALAARMLKETGMTLIPPYDHPDVIAGQGTVAYELLRQVDDLDLLVTPCGGGGLLSGCALAVAARNPSCRVVGVEPETADDATRSFHSGRLRSVSDPPTVADGLRTPSLGRLTFPLILRHVHDMVTISEPSITRAMHLLWSRMKIVVEPSGAVGIAALLSGAVQAAGLRVGVVATGGNVDMDAALSLLRGGANPSPEARR